jgi:hypothetical protein
LSALPLVLLPPLGRPREAPRPVFDFVAVLRFAAGLDAVERVAEPADFERDAVEPEPVVLRALLLLAVLVLRAVEPDRAPLDDERDDPELLVPELSSPVQLPDITRCAASATASAISDPSLVALDIMLLAALLALSAASMPASRIARRALGLAAIAAAAAVRPAASISLLIAALVILSIVESLDPEDERDEPPPDVPERFASERCLVVLRFAIWNSSLESRKRHFRTETVPASTICRI